MYTAGAQLLISASRHSLPSIVVGVLVGIAFQSNFLGLKRLKVTFLIQACIQQIASPPYVSVVQLLLLPICIAQM